MLSVAIATALLTALVTIARTAETRVIDQLAEGGPVSGISVSPAYPDPGDRGEDDDDGRGDRPIDDAVVEQIAALPHVRDVLPVMTTPVFVVRPGRGASQERMLGIDVSRPELLPVTPLAGRLPLAGSLVDVAVTERYLREVGIDRLDAEQVLGTEVEIIAPRVVDDPEGSGFEGRWIRLTIVGVVAQGAGRGQLLVPIEQARLARAWSTSGPNGGRDLGVGQSTYSGLFVVARGLENVGPTRDAIVAIGFASSAPENLIASVDTYLGVVEIVLASVGLIALIVAMLGIANALIATVRERRREIGVLKALGARDRDVVRMFVVEAAVIGFAGGAIGTVLGNFAARTVSAVVNGYLADAGLQGVQMVFPGYVLVGGLVGPTVIALIGGVIPARMAARLSPREAVNAS